MEAQPVAWTPERIETFWKYWASRSEGRARVLAGRFGKGVCKFLEHVGGPVSGKQMLDFATGRGQFVEQLLQRGATVSGVEFSEELVKDLNRRFQRDRCWAEARRIEDQVIPWSDGHFDAVFCLDVIEHLLPRDVDAVMRELLRVVKPGGVVLYTAPNSENLKSNTLFCPNCHCEFHRWQHIRRWTVETLSDRLSSLGYDVRFCEGLNFGQFQPKFRVGKLLQIGRVATTVADYVLDYYRPLPFPSGRVMRRRIARGDETHLVAAAFKPAVTVSGTPQAARETAA